MRFECFGLSFRLGAVLELWSVLEFGFLFILIYFSRFIERGNYGHLLAGPDSEQ